MSYINQIFGDITVREIIQEIYNKKGNLVVLKSGPEFEYSNHHVYKLGKKNICSVELGYQDINVDTNDNLCQSYSLMLYLGIPFDTTPSKDATIEQKYAKQVAMINMYRSILNNKHFTKIFSEEIIFEENDTLWTDWTNRKSFYIIQELRNATRIINNIKKVLDLWESYGWRYFVGDGNAV
jgi:hypothetical protein